jgi:tricorn protease interacting factor F2/3
LRKYRTKGSPLLEEEMRIDRYELHLDLNELERGYEGTERIYLEAEEEKLLLNAVDLKVKKILVNGKRFDFSLNRASEELFIDTILKGETTVDLEFSGKIGQTLMGFYLANVEDGEMFTTQFESSGARRTFPCIDHPAYKAQFSLSLTINEALDAVSNMPIKSSRKIGGKKAITFEDTPRMSTYLLYIGVGKFDERKEKYDDKEVILLAPKGHLTESTFPLDIAKKSLNLYEDYFGIKYMLPKLHLISVPEFAAGAMENWGAITLREVFMSLDSSTSGRYRKLTAEVIAHEIAHHWFGDLVTMKWWNDLWLNESFATFMSYKMVNEIFPEWDTWGDFVSSRTKAALKGDALIHSHPIDVDVKDPDSVAQIFDEISYGKGGSILRMIESYVGKDPFRDGIRHYLNKHSYQNAVGKDLWNAIEEVSGHPVNRIMEAWIKRKGYPLVTVLKKGDKIHLKQEQFLLSEKKKDTPWPIPLTVKRRSKTETILFEGEELEIDASDFLKLNLDQTGFYRVWYDERIFEFILLRLNDFSPLDRWGIVDDLQAFLISGRIGLAQYLDQMNAFLDESNHLVVEEIANQLSWLHLILPDHPTFVEFSKKFLKRQSERLGEKEADESENDAILRGTISREFSIIDMEFASKLSLKFSAFHDADPDMRSAIAIAEAVAHNDFSSLRDQLKSSKNDEDRTKLIGAMGWLRGDANLSKVLELIRTSQIKKQDIPVFYVSACANPKGREFMVNNLGRAVSELQNIFVGTGTTSRMIEQVIPLLGIGREDQVLEVVNKLTSTDIETGIKKGTELLHVYSKFVKTNAYLTPNFDRHA